MTLPGIRSVLVFVVSTTIIASMNMFGQSFLMTAGGPGNETRTAIMQISETGLRQFDSGMAFGDVDDLHVLPDHHQRLRLLVDQPRQ